jgi:hypothetical protein
LTRTCWIELNDHQQNHGAKDQKDRAQPIFPEGRTELHAECAADNVTDRLDEARCGPQTDQGAEPQQGAGANRQHLLDWLAQRIGDVRRQPSKHVKHRQLRILALPKKVSDRRRQDEERKQRQDRKIGEITRMDEAVGVNPIGHAFDHLPRRHPRLKLLFDLGAECRAHARKPFAPGFG